KEPAHGVKQQPVKKDNDALLVANFTESPNMEDLVQNQFRSTSIEALSPIVGKVASQPIIFKWKGYDEQVTVKVLSNKEVPVSSTTVDGTSLTLKKNLSPGLYYWKLESKEELLFVGKFIVK
ncbi:MAG: hypothetical protein PHP42_13730, partial [Bacteroidota bacterium]|nr:hypothetical protein [Bacteroidota bacterium]